MADEISTAGMSILPGEAGPEAPRRSRRSWLRDPRLGTALTVLAGFAAFAAMIGEWQTIPYPDELSGAATDQVITASILQLGGLGAALLVLLGLAFTAAAVVRFGAEQTRATARVAGLALVTGAGTVLAATWYLLGTSILLNGFIGVGRDTGLEAMTPQPGRGVYAASLSVVLLGVALWTSRGERAPSRPGRPADPDDESNEVMDLTVQAAPPFIR
jgi:hypothetical protein